MVRRPENSGEEAQMPDPEVNEEPAINRILIADVHFKGHLLNARIHNSLKCAEVYTIGQLRSKCRSELLRQSNFGIKSLDSVEIMLDGFGVRFDEDYGAVKEDFPSMELVKMTVSQRKRWEYRFVMIDVVTEDSETDLDLFNFLGDDGWELIQIERGCAFFKRVVDV